MSNIMWECFLFFSYTFSRVCHLCSLLTQHLMRSSGGAVCSCLTGFSLRCILHQQGFFICRIVSTISPFLTLLSGEASLPPDLVIWWPVNFFELNLFFSTTLQSGGMTWLVKARFTENQGRFLCFYHKELHNLYINTQMIINLMLLNCELS